MQNQNFSFDTGSIQGTATDLITRGICINGQKVDNVGLSVMAKYGIVQIVGKEEKPKGQRGKPGNIYKVPSWLVYAEGTKE